MICQQPNQNAPRVPLCFICETHQEADDFSSKIVAFPHKLQQIQTNITQRLHMHCESHIIWLLCNGICCIYHVLRNVSIKVKKEVTPRIVSLGHKIAIFSGCKCMPLWLPREAEIGICHCSRSQAGNPSRHWPDMLCWNCSQ